MRDVNTNDYDMASFAIKKVLCVELSILSDRYLWLHRLFQGGGEFGLIQ